MDYSKKMGALWAKESKSGSRYMTGFVTVDGVQHDVILFANNKRPDKNDPDWQIFPREPKDDSGAPF